MRPGILTSFALSLIVVMTFTGLPLTVGARDLDFVRGKCVEFGFKAGTPGHDDCVKQYLAAAGIRSSGKPASVEPVKAASGAKPAVPARLPGTVFKDCAECPEMVVIPTGRFQMGAAPGEEEDEQIDEKFRNRSQPQRWVEVSRFAAGKFEVTRGEYRLFAEATGRSGDGCWVWSGKEWVEEASRRWSDPGYPQDERHPVTCVSWDDAKAYAAWLTRRTGKAYRLLSEAEWEYVARAGTSTRRYWGNDGNQSCGYANGFDRRAQTQLPGGGNWAAANCDDGYAWTAPAGSFRANALGLHDTLGNVWEWVEDCWNGNYVGAPSDGRAWLGGDCSQRVVRGGSWDVNPRYLRAANRGGVTTTIRGGDLGFRVARTD